MAMFTPFSSSSSSHSSPIEAVITSAFHFSRRFSRNSSLPPLSLSPKEFILRIGIDYCVSVRLFLLEAPSSASLLATVTKIAITTFEKFFFVFKRFNN